MKTLTFVVGNNDYIEERAKLENAVNDATEIANVFERLGYEVISGFDCNTESICTLLEDYKSKINNYDASIFYFAGHGFQFDGENYLAATDCPIENANQYMCKRHSIMLAEITDIIKNATTTINIIIIDACRVSVGRGVQQHFTNVNAPEGTIIAFSTSPGESASDAGIDGHSIYTGTLLKYIGRERLSVEELFKKVRRTIFNLTGGSQTSWEHTSLVGDFYFNDGQMVHSITLPYDENVVKDRQYQYKGTVIDKIIEQLKTYNWHKQNPAILEFFKVNASDMTNNEKFIMGRNLYQCSGYAVHATNFIKDLSSKIQPYFDGEENHLLNGILYEIYFNSNGDFRHENIKKNMIDEVFILRHNDSFKKSFEFLGKILEPFQEEVFFIPIDGNEAIIDIDIFAEQKSRKEIFTDIDINYEEIQSVKINEVDILKSFSKVCQSGLNIDGLKNCLSDFLVAPEDKIHINTNIEIKNFSFIKSSEESIWF